MAIEYKAYKFTSILGWSSSRYELFDKCKRQYYYSYYRKFVGNVPSYKIEKLRALTSVPLEVGNIIHDILETFLYRLQKDDSNINEDRFFQYARIKADTYFSQKSFLETYYHQKESLDMDFVYEKLDNCLRNFLDSPLYSWIFMKALMNKTDWMIEPPGYGETRLDGLKAYCKMDFLFPVDGDVHILDWKTGRQDHYKHSNQLKAYAAAASSNFNFQQNKILPKIIYLAPKFAEFEIELKENDLADFINRVRRETNEMYTFCENIERNIPKNIDYFPRTPSETICRYCNYQELCYPDIHNQKLQAETFK